MSRAPVIPAASNTVAKIPIADRGSVAGGVCSTAPLTIPNNVTTAALKTNQKPANSG